MKKIFMLSAAVLMIATPAVTQEAELNFKLTTSELNLIGEALGNAPYNKAAPLLQKMRDQYLKLQAEAASAKKPEVELKKD